MDNIPVYKLYGLCQDITPYLNIDDYTPDDLPDPVFRNVEASDNYYEVRVRLVRGKNIDNDTYDGGRELIWSYTNTDDDIEEIVGYLGNIRNQGNMRVVPYRGGLACPDSEKAFVSFLGRKESEILDLSDSIEERQGQFIFVNSVTGDVDTRYYNYNVFLSLNAMIETQMQYSKNCKIFKSRLGAIKYLNTGDDSDEVEGGGDTPEEPAPDRITTLFYASDIYSRAYNDSTLNRIGASTIYIDIQYAKNDGTVIVDKHRAICGYVNTNNEINDSNHFGNIIWMAAPNTKIIETKQTWLNGGRAESQTLPNFANTTGFYPPLVEGSTIYESRYNTNMFIFANRQDAEAFLLGGNPTPVGGGGTGPFSPDKLVGDETEYNLHSAQLHNDMSSCWILSGSAVNELASIFATGVKQDTSNPDSAATVFESCLRGLAAHGEPIDMVCDLFWLPIDPTEFCSSENGTITVSRDSYGVLTAVKDISDEFGEHYKVSTAMNYNWVLGPAGQSLYTLNAIKESIQSVIGEEETSNKLHVGTHHDQSPIQ